MTITSGSKSTALEIGAAEAGGGTVFGCPDAGGPSVAGDGWNAGACQTVEIGWAGYLNWLSLLPARLNPMLAGRRSRTD